MQSKKQLQDVEAVQNEIVGQAHLENYALKLFLFADNEDRAARFGKYVAFNFQPSTKVCWQIICGAKVQKTGPWYLVLFDFGIFYLLITSWSRSK